MSRRALQQRIELEKSVRRLREMFQGKVSLDMAVLLMKRYHCDYSLVSKYIILMATDQDAGGLDADDRQEIEDDAVIKAVIEKLQDEENKAKTEAVIEKLQDDENKAKTENIVSELTVKNLAKFNLANARSIPHEDRQFSCSLCDRFWWRRVPARKQVSRCHGCGKKYDPVPYDKMWGYAEFHCQECGHAFGGFGQMGVPAPCYRCQSRVTPTRILPPKKSLGPRSSKPHSCFAEDCYNRREPHIPGIHCVHPRSRQRRGLPKVLYPSPLHVSTGSTINTCLSQGSLIEYLVDDIIAEDLRETDGEYEDGTEEDEDLTEKSDSVNNDNDD
ncbi:shiftless antiviral inhibitor of ribosomal frameshifting protein homolog isoform X1 [Mobula birostris]|uniref:shiftless antiviral inhibitor of ribosomal frameshifting protein homolog isoform X1 n=1 Tax=Mobula birostris TaxID=1983395 RepID=UPI003B27DD55